MKNKSVDNTNISKTIITVAIILGLSILGYGFLNYQTKVESIKAETAKEERAKIDIESARLEEKSIRENCYTNAIEQATDLLKTKSSLPGGENYKDAVNKNEGLYLKDDFNTLYENCLSKNGIKP